MKRDADILRAILLYCEENLEAGGVVWISDEELTHFMKREATIPNNIIEDHYKQLEERGFVEYGIFDPERCDDISIGRITSNGHDFVDVIRDEGIWSDTKDAAKKAGGFTLEILKDIAKGLIKKQVKRLSDVDIYA